MDRLEEALEIAKQRRLERDANDPQGRRTSGFIDKSPTFVASVTELKSVDEAFMDRHRIVAYRAHSKEADIYRQLRTKVLQTLNATGAKTLAITSPNYNDGKTTVALNLGISIALDLKQTVLLVDLDLRKPNLHQYLGIQPKAGLSDYLLKDVPLSECLIRLPFERVSILPAGTALDRSSEVLGAPKMISLAKELKSRYPDRFVIYDMPPVLDQDDPIAFLPQTDAVLVVVHDGVTKTEDLKRCLNTLSGANVIGTVLNNGW